MSNPMYRQIAEDLRAQIESGKLDFFKLPADGRVPIYEISDWPLASCCPDAATGRAPAAPASKGHGPADVPLRGQHLLVDEFAHRPEEFLVQVPAGQAVQPASAAGHAIGRRHGQRDAAVLAADGDRDGGEHADDDSAEDECDYDSGHDGLQYLSPRSSSADPACCDPAMRGPRRPGTRGHGVPVCPRSVRTVRYVRPRLTILSSGAI
jgi:hypothetical protein